MRQEPPISAGKPAARSGRPAPNACAGEIGKRLDIIRKEIVSELERGFRHTDSEVQRLHSGIFGSIVKLVYNYQARDQIQARGRQQLEVLLECAGECDVENFEDIIEEHFDDYLFYDEAYMRSRQLHPKHDALRRLVWRIYRSRVEAIIAVAKGTGDSYAQLVRSAMTKAQALDLLTRDFEHVDKLIALVKREKGLLDIPTVARNDVIRMLDISCEYAKKRIRQRIEEIYSK